MLALVDSTSIGTLAGPLWWLLVPGRLRVRSLLANAAQATVLG